MITDLRGNEAAEREKYLYKLAEDIMWQAFVFDYPPGVGQFIKKYGSRFNAIGMYDLKSHHFNMAEWRIKKLLGKNHSI